MVAVHGGQLCGRLADSPDGRPDSADSGRDHRLLYPHAPSEQPQRAARDHSPVALHPHVLQALPHRPGHASPQQTLHRRVLKVRTRRERLKSAIYLTLKNRKVFKLAKGRTFRLFENPVCCKILKKLKGDPLAIKKLKKSRTVPKKLKPYSLVRFCILR